MFTSHNVARSPCDSSGRGRAARLCLSAALPAAVVALLLGVTPSASASTHAAFAGGGSVPQTVKPKPVIGGKITWKSTFSDPSTHLTFTQTGVFDIAVEAMTNPPLGQEWQDEGSHYTVTDHYKVSSAPGDSCPTTTTGSTTASGGIGPDFSLLVTWGPPYSKWVSFQMNVNASEKQVTNSCNGSTRQTVSRSFLPECYNIISKYHMPGVSGQYKATTDTSGTIPISCHGTAYGFTYTATGNLTVSTGCAPPFSLSGPGWADRFPQSHVIDTLVGTFKKDVIKFKDAMQKAGIHVSVISTFRPRERAYLMHYTWLIRFKDLSPADVPPFKPEGNQEPVDICWLHYNKSGGIDMAASVKAAIQLEEKLGIDPTLTESPKEDSNHTKGLAIDMTTTWSATTIAIVDGNGHTVKIDTNPHTGLNLQLMAVGKTYGVIHFCYQTCTKNVPGGDKNHWSVNGH